MSKIEMLRLLITERLTAAAEEIFAVLGRTIAEYEEEICRSRQEIDRQRRLLDLSRKPRVCVPPAASGLSQQADWSPGLDLDRNDPPEVKEEDEELWPQDEAALFQSAGASDRDPSASSAPEPPRVPSAPDPAESADPASDGEGAALSEVVEAYICTICGRAFAQRRHWTQHLQVHRRAEAKPDKSYTCNICGKRLTRFDGYQKHMRVHTGEKPYSCEACGRRFSDNSNYKRHSRTHMAAKAPQR